jgi:DNA topoisomerase-1
VSDGGRGFVIQSMPVTTLSKRSRHRSRSHPRPRRPEPFADPAAAAAIAALRHVSDAAPGIRRQRSGRGFSYVSSDGSRIGDAATLARIRALAIPPAWRDVWICPIAHGHLQATGRDARGRKQYRYHARWSTVRAATKYERTLEFGSALPAIRARLAADLAKPEFPKEKVLAIVVTLLETTLIRVGNEEYSRTNKSFGLTTLQDRHVAIDGTMIRFRFRGKSGKTHEIELADRRLSRLVARCRELPGQHLFQYAGDGGEPHAIDSADVNEYIREISGRDFTAKDFRTWGGSLLAARRLVESHPFDGETTPKTALNAAVATVAAALGNTVAVCRNCYIHPAVLGAYEHQQAYERWVTESSSTECPDGLEPDEAALLRFLASAQS